MILLEIKTGPTWEILIPVLATILYGITRLYFNRVKYIKRRINIIESLRNQKYDPGDFKREESDSDQALFT